MGKVNFPGRQAEEEEFFLGELTELFAAQGSTGDSWKAKVTLNRPLPEFELDTGADLTVIPSSLQHSLQLLMGPCRQKLRCLGTYFYGRVASAR